MINALRAEIHEDKLFCLSTCQMHAEASPSNYRMFSTAQQIFWSEYRSWNVFFIWEDYHAKTWKGKRTEKQGFIDALIFHSEILPRYPCSTWGCSVLLQCSHCHRAASVQGQNHAHTPRKKWESVTLGWITTHTPPTDLNKVKIAQSRNSNKSKEWHQEHLRTEH